jgi:hypothetical protein
MPLFGAVFCLFNGSDALVAEVTLLMTDVVVVV